VAKSSSVADRAKALAINLHDDAGQSCRITFLDSEPTRLKELAAFILIMSGILKPTRRSLRPLAQHNREGQGLKIIFRYRAPAERRQLDIVVVVTRTVMPLTSGCFSFTICQGPCSRGTT